MLIEPPIGWENKKTKRITFPKVIAAENNRLSIRAMQNAGRGGNKGKGKAVGKAKGKGKATLKRKASEVFIDIDDIEEEEESSTNK